jgi:succinate dehydrogenase/fumarate reductase flavoprotein subunit
MNSEPEYIISHRKDWRYGFALSLRFSGISMSTKLGPTEENGVKERPQLLEFGTVSTGAVVIGHTVAGLRVATQLAQAGVPVRVIGPPTFSSAAVGFNADPGDPVGHTLDTLSAGKMLNEPRSALTLAARAPDILDKLQSEGCPLGTNNGQQKADSHTQPRTVFGEPDTPTALFTHLSELAVSLGVEFDQNHLPVTLLEKSGTVGGIFALNLSTRCRVFIKSPAVIVADGDYTGLYTSDGGSGRGLGLAFSTGALLRDMEFLVFDGPTPVNSLGGVDVDPNTGESLVVGLFAVGDAAGGWHGGGSLPGNRLAASIVSADLTADHVASTSLPGLSRRTIQNLISDHTSRVNTLLSMRGPVPVSSLLDDLRAVFTGILGKQREEETLQTAIDRFIEVKESCVELGVSEKPSIEELSDVLALESLLFLAEAVIRAALHRTESSGHHRRQDFAGTDEVWQETVLTELGTFGVVTPLSRPLPELPKELRERFE